MISAVQMIDFFRKIGGGCCCFGKEEEDKKSATAIKEEKKEEGETLTVVKETPMTVIEETPVVLLAKEGSPMEVVEGSLMEVVEGSLMEVVEGSPMAMVEESPMEVVEGSLMEVVEGSPMAMVEEETPSVVVIDRSPMAMVEESPMEVVEGSLMEVVEGSPMAMVEEETPSVVVINRSPMAMVKEETPSVVVIDRSPMAVVKEETPSVVVIDRSPMAMVEEETPSVVVIDRSPMVVVKEETPSVVVIDRSPMAVVIDRSPPMEVVIEEPPQMVEEQRLTVVLDLDNTLIHTDINECKQGYYDMKFELNNDKVSNLLFCFCLFFKNSFNLSNYLKYFVQIRPYLKQFLQKASKHFELVLFTAAEEEYAKIILKEIDPNGDYFDLNLFRDSCTIIQRKYFKDLYRINRDLKRILLIDDRSDVFGLLPCNGLQIKAWNGDLEDDELPKLYNLLKIVDKSPDVRYFLLTRTQEEISLKKGINKEEEEKVLAKERLRFNFSKLLTILFAILLMSFLGRSVFKF